MKNTSQLRSKAPAWQLQTAKAQFSELFRRARAEGPQYVTKAGKEAVVVVPAEQFEQLIARRPAQESGRVLPEFSARGS